MPAAANAMTIPMIHVNSLSKFIRTSLCERDLFGFESGNDVDDGVAIPFRCTSSRDLLRIESIGDAIGIRL